MSTEIFLAIVCLYHGLLESFTIKEWEQIDTHPSVSGTIDIKTNITWVKVDNLTFRLIELPIALWNSMRTLNWENRQELLEGLRWFTFLEFNFEHVATQ